MRGMHGDGGDAVTDSARPVWRRAAGLAMQADLWFRGGLFLTRFIAGRWQRTRV
jgi:hypothetical protein